MPRTLEADLPPALAEELSRALPSRGILFYRDEGFNPSEAVTMARRQRQLRSYHAQRLRERAERDRSQEREEAVRTARQRHGPHDDPPEFDYGMWNRRLAVTPTTVSHPHRTATSGLAGSPRARRALVVRRPGSGSGGARRERFVDGPR